MSYKLYQHQPTMKYYFDVLYTERSNRKNKNYDTGYLCITLPQSLQLLDETGKLLSKSTQVINLNKLNKSAKLIVGLYEIEIDCETYIDETTYKNKIKQYTNNNNNNNDDDDDNENISASNNSNTSYSIYKKSAKTITRINTIRQSNVIGLHRNSSKLPKPNTLRHNNNSNNNTIQQRWLKACIYDANDPESFILNRSKLDTNNIYNSNECPVIINPTLSNKLRSHQRDGVQFMYDIITGNKLSTGHTGCILADSMGLGKTLQVLTLVYTLLRTGMKNHKIITVIYIHMLVYCVLNRLLTSS